MEVAHMQTKNLKKISEQAIIKDQIRFLVKYVGTIILIKHK